MTSNTPTSGAHPSRTADGTMKIRLTASGEIVTRMAPDAQALVRSGEALFVPADTPDPEQTEVSLPSQDRR